MILRGRAATVVEDRVPFLIESELFRGKYGAVRWRNARRDDHVSKFNLYGWLFIHMSRYRRSSLSITVLFILTFYEMKNLENS